MERVSLLVWVLLIIVMMHKPTANPDGDALSVFKQALFDPNNAIANWDPLLANPTTWWRVVCNSDNSVTNMNLGRQGFSGRLVPELGKLKSLQHVLLNDNKISGAIPDEIGDLSNLMDLDLDNNVLNGSIPNSLGNLSEIRYLDLSNNQLRGQIPMGLFKLPKLQYMNLSNNNLSGTVTKELVKRIGLLDLSKNDYLEGPCTKSACYNIDA